MHHEHSITIESLSITIPSLTLYYNNACPVLKRHPTGAPRPRHTEDTCKLMPPYCNTKYVLAEQNHSVISNQDHYAKSLIKT